LTAALGHVGRALGLNAPTENSWTPAHQAVELDDVEALTRLLDSGTDPNEVCGGMTLLTHAIDLEGDTTLQSGQPLTVHTTAALLAHGADPQLIDPGGRTPLETAVGYDHALAVRLLERRMGSRKAP
jgi:ankyrin repeat protein